MENIEQHVFASNTYPSSQSCKASCYQDLSITNLWLRLDKSYSCQVKLLLFLNILKIFCIIIILFGFTQTQTTGIFWFPRNNNLCQRVIVFCIPFYISLNVKASQYFNTSCPLTFILREPSNSPKPWTGGEVTETAAIPVTGLCGPAHPDTVLLSIPLSFKRTSKSNKRSLNPAWSFSNSVMYFWSSSSWKKIPKMVGHFKFWKSTILQWPQPSFSQIITQLENTWELYIPPQATSTLLYCLLKLRVLHENTKKH